MRKNEILLMGNPNVGKSVIFSKLTGAYVTSSNFAGTTVSFTKGKVKLGDKTYTLIDVPGVYSLKGDTEADHVAIRMLNKGAAAIICVLDSTNIERNLHFALELQKYKIPILFVLNLMDVAARQGIAIDVQALEQELGAQVITTVAVQNQGFEEVEQALFQLLTGDCGKSCASCAYAGCSSRQLWEKAEQIADKVETRTAAKPTFLDRLGKAMIKPWPGVLIAVIAMALSIAVIITGGELLISWIFEPLISGLYIPFVQGLFPQTMNLWQTILAGEYGILIVGPQWIFESILPYVFMFYAVFSFLEDCGYLPRLAVMFDNLMSKFGLQGGSFITILMGYGCAVPAIIGSRTASTRKERIIIASVVCFSVPCITQTSALIVLLGSYSLWMFVAMMVLAAGISVIVATVVSKVYPGPTTPMVMEIPNLLLPNAQAYGKKLYMRLKGFLMEAEIPMLIAVVVASLISATGVLNVIAVYLQPLVVGWLGLPKEAVIFLILGIIRREMSVTPLLAMNLNPLQIFVGGAVSLLYLPCISVFGIISKELGVKTAVGIGVGTVVTAFVVGGLINHIGLLFL